MDLQFCLGGAMILCFTYVPVASCFKAKEENPILCPAN
jgi:hypothetical protein